MAIRRKTTPRWPGQWRQLVFDIAWGSAARLQLTCLLVDNTVLGAHNWNAIVSNDGEESACGWCKDRWGLSWQITPRVLTDALAAGGAEAARAFQAMMTMHKIDVAHANSRISAPPPTE